MMLRVAIILFVLCGPCHAATFYVRTNGSDAADGSLSTPWLTIQKACNTMAAGDTALIGHGDFPERVATGAHGSEGSRITLKAETNWTASLRQIRMQHRWHSLDGLKVDKTIDIDPLNLNAAHIRIEPAALSPLVTNCWIGDTPLLNARFHFTTNNNELLCTITNTTANFLTNNFVVGGHIFIGANSLTYHTNHDKGGRIKAISADGQTLTVTNLGGTNWFIEQNQNRWATIYAGQGNGGFDGILLVLGTGVHGPTNAVIINNVLSNLTGAAFVVNGESNLIKGNYITKLNGYYAIRPFGRHTVVRENTWRNSPNRIWFSDSETADITHPGDGSFFDYNIGAIHSQGSGTTNLLFERNWVENFEQQLGVISKQSQTDQGVFTIRSNVFIGLIQHWSQNSDWLTNANNTFYRIATESSHAVTAGGFDVDNKQTNLAMVANAFIDCGRQHDPTTGWYSTRDTHNHLLTNNFACGPEATGWHPKTTSPSNHVTFNGGDPVLLNPLNPIGPDGLAFTDDDGLKPLPSSRLAVNGVGALNAVTVTAGTPIAHFSIATPTNWLDYIYTNFSTVWAALEPFERGAPVRPYTVADPIGNVPALVKFTATNSIGGLDAGSTTPNGITHYGWDFGDGYRAMTTTNGEAWHTFARTGTVVVKLWVTNRLGNWSVYSNAYRILPFTNFAAKVWYVSTNGNNSNSGTNENAPFLTLAKAETVVSAGDYVAALPGRFTNEVLDIDRNVATAAGRITYIGYGARVGGLNIRHPHYTFDGFELTGENTPGKVVYIYQACSNMWLLNNYIHNPSNSVWGVFCEPPTGPNHPTLGQTSLIISNNLLKDVHYVNLDIQGSNNIITRNTILNTGTEGSVEGDVVRLFGANHTFSFNYCSNIFGGHADLFQAFGTNYWSKDMLVDGNIFHGTTNGSGTSLCQFEMDPNSTDYTYTNQLQYTNWVIRNNQFILIPGAGSVDFDGFKFYNNLFYLCRTNSGAPLALGGPKGSAYTTVLKNNIFFGCGNGTANGWYPKTNDQPGITWNFTLDADHNYVSKADFSSYLEAPPNDNERFRADGQDANGINGGNPKFVNAGGFNFHLLATSPLLDEGATIGGFSMDAEGTTRPQGAAWDIGPFEGSSEALTMVDSLSGNIRISGDNVIMR